MNIVTCAVDCYEARITEAVREGLRCTDGDRLVECTVHLEHWDLDILVGPSEEADPVDAVLSADEGEKRSTGATYPEGCLEPSTVRIGEGIAEDDHPTYPKFTDAGQQWNELDRVDGQPVSDKDRAPNTLWMVRCKKRCDDSAGRVAQDDNAINS